MPELSVVIPVYNEVDAIAGVLAAWDTVLSRLEIDREILVYDDGSTDGTGAVLADVAKRMPTVTVCTHANRGHGPTILRGYREARGAWIFQVDGDDELSPVGFEQLWKRRNAYDLLLGSREGRGGPLGRRIVSAVSRRVVGVLFGRSVRDVNSPYRLMRASELRSALAQIPAGTFAPNVAVTGLFGYYGLRVFEAPVAYRERRTGAVSIGGGKLWSAAAKSLLQTIHIRLRSRGRVRADECPPV